MQPHRRVIAVIAAVALPLAACSDDAGDAATTDTNPTTPTATDPPPDPTVDVTTPSTDVADPTTPPTEPPATDPPSTEPPTTPPPTELPTTTETPMDEVEAAVREAVVTSREAYLYAVYNVEAPDWRERLEASATGDSLARGISIVEDLLARGYRARANPEIPSAATPEGNFELIDATT